MPPAAINYSLMKTAAIGGAKARALSIQPLFADDKGPRAIELLRHKPGKLAARRENRPRPG